MKKLIYFMFIISMLAACGQQAQLPDSSFTETPLLTDQDFDHALLQGVSNVEKLEGTDGGYTAGGQTLTPLGVKSSGLSTQAVLPDTSGFDFYVKYTQSVLIGTPSKGSKPYSLYLHDQQTDVRTLIYSGDRPIQSVAGSLDGTMVLVSMRETTTSSSDFEIFSISLADPTHPFLVNLTSDTVDNTNVSVSRNFDSFVFEEPVAGIQTVVLGKKNSIFSFRKTVLTQTLPQRQPSISGDGRYVSLIRDLANGTDRVFTYDIALNSYLNVATSTAVLEYPSLSDNGLKVLWLENGTPDKLMIKNLITASTQVVASEVSMNHPFLTADGKFITYQSGRNIVTKDLQTAQVQTIASSFTNTISFFAPSWQKAGDNKFIGTSQSGFYPSQYGGSVAIDGDLMVVGATGETNGRGAVYLYKRSSLGTWEGVTGLTASDGIKNKIFGADVGISGDTIVVGASEAVYIFQKDQGGVNHWGQVKKLLASDGAAGDRFGRSVAISGNTVVIGAYFDDHDINGLAGDEPDVGAAYIFQRNLGGANNWGQLKKLSAGDQAAYDNFGCDVAVSGTTVVVGACNESHDTNGTPGDEGRVGAAYIFEQNQGGSNTFGQIKKLIASDGAVLDQFGVSVSISGATVLIGAHAEDHNADTLAGDETNVGAAYLFQKDQGGTGNWGEVKKLIASDGASFDFFGYAVSISGDSLVIGAYDEAHDTNGDSTDEARVGAAYLFQKDQGGLNNWGQVRKLVAFDGATGDSFSEGAIAISGGTIVVGAWSDDNASGVNAGAAYFYE